MDDLTKHELSFRDFTIGTLWWAWEQLISQNYSTWGRNKQRMGHPLLSMLKNPPEDDLCFIPMLPGTTLRKSPRYVTENGLILVRGLTRKDPEHQTLFGEVFESTGGFVVSEFLHYDEKAAKKLTGAMSDVRKIWSNIDKPRCNESEMAVVERYYEQHFTNESVKSGDYQE